MFYNTIRRNIGSKLKVSLGYFNYKNRDKNV